MLKFDGTHIYPIKKTTALDGAVPVLVIGKRVRQELLHTGRWFDRNGILTFLPLHHNA